VAGGWVGGPVLDCGWSGVWVP